MRRITAEPITAAAFAPYGDVLAAPETPGRIYYDDRLANGRAGVPCSLAITNSPPTGALPLTVVQMERHAFSSQSFMPLVADAYLVVVAPANAQGQPDTDQVRAFEVPGDVGITYGHGVWHHPMVVLDTPARFAVMMWRDGTADDEEFVQLAMPFEVAVAGR